MAAKPETDISQLRTQIERIKDELLALDDDALPPDEWRARLLQWVDRESAAFEELFRFRLSSARVLYNGHQTEVEALDLPVRAGIGDDLARAPMAGLVCWLLRDTLLERINAIVDEADYPFGLPSTERPVRRRKLKEQLDILEAREEVAIRALEIEDRQIPRRKDARPELVLAWQEDLEARAGGKQP